LYWETLLMKPLSDRAPAVRETIRWTDDEWDRLATIVFGLRLKHPELSLIDCAARAQEQFPAERRRKLPHTQSLQPLIRRLVSIGELVRAAASEADRLRDAIASRPTFEDELAALGEDQIVERFRGVVMRHLSLQEVFEHFPLPTILQSLSDEEILGHASKRLIALVQALQELQKVPQSVPDIPPAAAGIYQTSPAPPLAHGMGGPPKPKPTVIFIGLKGDQPSHISAQVGNKARLRFIETGSRQRLVVPTNGDLYVLWARFCSHDTQMELQRAVPKERCVIHHGGLNNMAAIVVKKLATIH
jgi:hypothetical protein